ncbi:PBSX family phage terminase large subunit [Candidatus Parcubacteria bacterium]|nr:MAG: PBSX family phage terminase large subunit [Candidatus Parcubacteria bacterium]
MATAKVKAQLPLPPKAVKVFSRPARIRALYGGRGSGKTQTFALMTAVDGYRLACQGYTGTLLCGREHFTSLEDSSMQEVKDAIRRVPWLNEFYEIGEKFIRTKDRRIHYTFTGLRQNLQSIKSRAKILRCWIDEAEHVSEAAWRMLMPTIREEVSEIFISWNPESPTSATHLRFRANPPEDCIGEMINWNDNPWFPEILNKERLHHLKTRPDTYKHVWEGEFLILTDALVFANRFCSDVFEPRDDWDGPYQGLDFGFAKDPTAAIRAYIDGRTLYIRHAWSQVGVELDETASKVANAIPRFNLYPTRADNARPESISYLQRHGMPQLKAVKKWNGSIEDGIEFIKSFDKIVIHAEDALAAMHEFSSYCYKVDRLSGDIMPVIMPGNDHTIDALRYALAPLIRRRGQPRILSL